MGLLENGPMFDWTRDENMYARFLLWKQRVSMVFKSALRTVGEAAQCECLKYWMGKEGLPLLDHWEKSGRITTEGDDPPGHKLQTYYDLLEIECKPKANKMIPVMQLWSPKSQQHNLPLNEWITKVHNMVDLCAYSDEAKDSIVRDILISGSNSDKAKDKIIHEPHEPNLDRIIEILQIEDSTKHSMKNIVGNEETSTAQVHLAQYDSKSKAWAKNKNQDSTSSSSNSTEGKKCFRCGKAFTLGYMKKCKAIREECDFCGIIGHFEKCCNKKKRVTPKKENFMSTRKVHVLSLAHNEYFDKETKMRNQKSNSTSIQRIPVQLPLCFYIHVQKCNSTLISLASSHKSFKRYFLSPSRGIPKSSSRGIPQVLQEAFQFVILCSLVISS